MRKMEKIHFNLRASAVGGERGVPQKLTKITKSPYLWQGQGGGEKENPKILWTSYMEATLVISKCSFCRQTSLGEGRGGLYCSARVRLSSFRLGRHFRRITRRTNDAALWKREIRGCAGRKQYCWGFEIQVSAPLFFLCHFILCHAKWSSSSVQKNFTRCNSINGTRGQWLYKSAKNKGSITQPIGHIFVALSRTPMHVPGF